MSKTTLLLFILMMMAACGKSGGGSSGVTGDMVSLDEIAADSPVPSAAQNFSINVKMDNFDSSQEDKVIAAADLIKKVIASDDFKNKILKFSHKGKKGFIDNDGMSNAEIYKKIIEGSEDLRPGTDNEMDLDLEVFKDNSSTVGYTYPNVIKVWMNEKFLNRNKAAEVTTNMMHEWLHKLGFKHAKTKTASRKYSVPYAIGYLVRNLARKMD